MLNKGLKYMLDDDPTKTLSKKGVVIRDKIRPILQFMLKISNKQQLTVEKCWFDPSFESRPIVYVCSHGFKDDCQNMLVSAKPDGFLIFGNIDLFFNTFDGTIAWAYGSQVIDRFSKTSRQAMKAKMDRIIELGSNVIIFPEATWNLSPNKPMLGLHWGFYDTAVKNGAVIVPILTHKVGNKCYSRILASIDPKEIWKNEVDSIYLLMKKYLDKARDILMYKSSIACEFQKEFSVLEESINGLGDLINKLDEIKENKFNLPDSKRLVMYLYESMDNVLNKIDIMCNTYSTNFKSKFKDDLDGEDSIENSAYKLVAKLISRIGSARKEVVVKYVRDIMALEKVDMYKTHPDDYYMVESKDMYEAWERYVEDTLKGTPYFYVDEEEKSAFKDPLIQDIDEVMPWLKDKTKKLK